MDQRTERLLAWYDRNARKMPWRGEKDPYRIWVSEAMLQQTRVETVMGYYDRFLQSFPTLQSLALAEEKDVLKQWEGLGYYSRARNLQAGARQVIQDFGGTLPADPAELRKIHGIGPYTAGAIASIAFGVPVAAVDGNVIRVISRLYAIEENPEKTEIRDRVQKLAEKLVPTERPGDHNQAMMDLGATVCVPGTPDCEICPLLGLCQAEKRGIAAELPRLSKAKPPREIRYDLLILRSGSQVLMRKRTEKMLQGLWCFPMMEDWKSETEITGEIRKKWGFSCAKMICHGEAKHVFTHQTWRMMIYETEIAGDCETPKGYRFVSVGEFEALAMPTAMKKARALVLDRFQHNENVRKTENNGEK